MDEIYKSLGWQGGTIHQILDEIKRLKQVEKTLNELTGLVINEDSICEPINDYKLKDVKDWKCESCRNNSLCNFLIEKELL